MRDNTKLLYPPTDDKPDPESDLSKPKPKKLSDKSKMKKDLSKASKGSADRGSSGRG
jgi:hypothetical protein